MVNFKIILEIIGLDVNVDFMINLVIFIVLFCFFLGVIVSKMDWYEGNSMLIVVVLIRWLIIIILKLGVK